MASATAPLSITNRFGYRLGDLILLAQPGTFPAQTCNFMEVTSIPVGTLQVNHDAVPYTNALGNVVNARFNPAAPGGEMNVKYGGSSAQASATRVFNLGNVYDPNTTPVYDTYAVSNNTLTVKSAFSPTPAVAVADNIIDLRALYGLDDGVDNGTVTYSTNFAAGDGVVDRYLDGAAFGAVLPLPWANIIAVRVAVVARSATPETSTKGVGQACDATANAPAWSGGTFPAVQADPNWQCYRYRVYETTVPLRNWIWKSS
jgi:type IV pilus assembly protein PilW